MNPSDMYDTERIQKISEIMPRFNAHVQPNDTILFGLEGDPLFPESFKANRPTGVVQKVKSNGSPENSTIRVKMSNGQTKDIPYGSVNPETLWEFSDDTFQEVLKRSIDRNMPESPDYRGVSAEVNEVNALRAELNALKGSMEQERSESQNFNNALIATLHEMATDVCKNQDAPFCKVFNTEYSKMMSTDQEENAFDSDFSSNASDMDPEEIN